MSSTCSQRLTWALFSFTAFQTTLSKWFDWWYGCLKDGQLKVAVWKMILHQYGKTYVCELKGIILFDVLTDVQSEKETVPLSLLLISDIERQHNRTPSKGTGSVIIHWSICRVNILALLWPHTVLCCALATPPTSLAVRASTRHAPALVPHSYSCSYRIWNPSSLKLTEKHSMFSNFVITFDN